MVALMIVVIYEGVDLSFQVARLEVIFEQYPVFQSLMPTLNLPLCLGVVRGTSNMIHAFVAEPFSQIA